MKTELKRKLLGIDSGMISLSEITSSVSLNTSWMDGEKKRHNNLNQELHLKSEW